MNVDNDHRVNLASGEGVDEDGFLWVDGGVDNTDEDGLTLIVKVEAILLEVGRVVGDGGRRGRVGPLQQSRLIGAEIAKLDGLVQQTGASASEG